MDASYAQFSRHAIHQLQACSECAVPCAHWAFPEPQVARPWLLRVSACMMVEQKKAGDVSVARSGQVYIRLVVELQNV